jgi:hypothetical protein
MFKPIHITMKGRIFIAVLGCLQALLPFSAGAQAATKAGTCVIQEVRVANRPQTNGKPDTARFGDEVTLIVSGTPGTLSQRDSARIYINRALMPYKVTYNCPACAPSNDSSVQRFSLSFTLSPHDTTWNRWYGFGHHMLYVRVDAGTAAKPLTCAEKTNLIVGMYEHGWLIASIILVILFVALTIYLVFGGGSLIRDQSTATPKPFSLSRFQLLWWSVIVISCYILLFAIRGDFELLSKSTLILLGISATATGFARVIDYSDSDSDKDRHQDQPGKNFFSDILSDNNGISIHRYQNFVFTVVFGVIFVYKVFSTGNMPNFGTLDLTLMGLSTATYVGLKTGENNNTDNSVPNGTPGPNDNIAG